MEEKVAERLTGSVSCFQSNFFQFRAIAATYYCNILNDERYITIKIDKFDSLLYLHLKLIFDQCFGTKREHCEFVDKLQTPTEDQLSSFSCSFRKVLIFPWIDLIVQPCYDSA